MGRLPMAFLYRVLWFVKGLLISVVLIGVLFNGSLQLESDDGFGLFLLIGGGAWALSSFLVGWRIAFYDKFSELLISIYCLILGAFFFIFMYGKIVDFSEGMPGSIKYILIYIWPLTLCVSTPFYLALRKRVRVRVRERKSRA